MTNVILEENMKKNKVKKFLICLFSFMFIASACITSGILLSGSSYSVPASESGGVGIQDNENLTNDNNDVTSTATEPTNDGSWTDSGNYDTTFAGGSGTESDPYLISTARQLAGVAYYVNSFGDEGEHTYAYYRQTADIDLSAYWWDAIGTNYFRGHYDGDGHTVSGVFTESTRVNIGLFSFTNGAEISNVGVINSHIQGNSYVGGVVGYAYTTKITNCYNTGLVTGGSGAGGIVGYNENSTITNSYNTGTVSGYGSIGGVVGQNDFSSIINNSYNTGAVKFRTSAVSLQNLGGVVGANTNSSTVSNSYNSGVVEGTNRTRVGGVVGYNFSSSTVKNSYNTEDVTGDSYVGGVVGYNGSASIVNNLYNTGAVNGTGPRTGGLSTTGGVVGQNDASTITNSYNTGSVSISQGSLGGVVGANGGTVSNSYNTGRVEGNGSVGGIAGGNGTSSTITNTYNKGYVGGSGYAGGVVGSNSGTVSNSYNVGLVEGAGPAAILGNNSSLAVVSNCYYGGNCPSSLPGIKYGTDVEGEAEYLGTITTDAKTLSWYTTTSNWDSSSSWDFESVWNVNPGANDGYPYLKQIPRQEPWTTSLMWTDNGVTRDTDFEGSGTESNPYLISNAEELAGLAYNVNFGGNTYSEKYFKQTANIDVSAYWWDAIGTSNNNFSGNYDGGGHTVSGVFTQPGSTNDYSYQGLFGLVGNGSEENIIKIENIVIEDSYIQGNSHVGGIVGYMSEFHGSSVIITNCYNSGNVSGNDNVGGILGDAVMYSSDVTLTNCYNTGNVSGNNYVGGILGQWNESSGGPDLTITNCNNTGVVTGNAQIGGIVGKLFGEISNPTISNSYNTGVVSGSSYVGGVVGYNYSSTVSNSYNTGDVTGNATSLSGSSCSCYTGGVVGYNNSSTVTNSYNTGSVSGSATLDSSYTNACTGGVVGMNYSSSTVTNSYNTGSVTGNASISVSTSAAADTGGVVGYNNSSTVTNSYNTGSVSGSATAPSSGSAYVRTGGVVGNNGNNSTVTNCYFGGDYTGSYGIGSSGSSTSGINYGTTRIASLNSTSYAKGLSWYTTSSNWYSSYPWDFTYVWALDSSINDGYPHFKEITITFHSNDGTNQTHDQNFLATSVNLPNDVFSRTGYELSGWNTNSTGTGTSYTPGENYQIATDLDLYAIWEAAIYNITLNKSSGASGTSNFYVKYNTGFYSNSSATSEISSISSLPTRNGYKFNGYYIGENGQGYQVVDKEGNILVSNTFFTGNTTIYAYWTPNVPAYYDEIGGNWYIEYGRMPQTKVTDNAIINALDGDSVLSDSDGVTTSNYVYYFAGMMLSAKVYQGEEYCNLDGNWYLVEPIRWRLDIEPSTSGYVSTDTIAIMENVVYVGKYSDFSLSVGDGYVSANANSSSDIDYFLNNFLPNEKEYLTEFSASSDVFGTTNITTETSTNSIFLSSNAEISELFGTYESEFSDFVNDYLNMYGQNRYYFVRDLGSNLNNIDCHSQSGATGINQRSTEFLGMRFTIQVDEFVCL